ncbi:MAG: hypothetical protein KDK70_44495, partial [Myxococcales bacterium]|nr:hypothetical protein [Myxococcales bacterium]
KAQLLEPTARALASVRGVDLDAERFLRVIRDDSGLLTGWGVDSYGFMHLGFQEYLTARHLRSEGLVDAQVFAALAERFDDSWWQEVILLMLALRDPPVFEPFMRAVAQRPEFSRWIDSEMMQLCLRETAKVSLAPFVEALSKPAQDVHSAVANMIARGDISMALVDAAIGELEPSLRPILQSATT